MSTSIESGLRTTRDPVGLDKVSWISPVVPTRPMTERFELPMDLTTLEGELKLDNKLDRKFKSRISDWKLKAHRKDIQVLIDWEL